VVLVTKVTAFSTSRPAQPWPPNHGSRSSGCDESDGFFKYFYITTTIKIINKKTSHFGHRPIVAFLVIFVTSTEIPSQTGLLHPQPELRVSQTASFEAWKDRVIERMVPEAVLPTGIGSCCLKACAWNHGGRAFITERKHAPPMAQTATQATDQGVELVFQRFEVQAAGRLDQVGSVGAHSPIAELATAMRKGFAERRSIVRPHLDFLDRQSHWHQLPASATVLHHLLPKYRS
jgi:hypothetical protein